MLKAMTGGHNYGGEPRLAMGAGGIGLFGPVLVLLLVTEVIIIAALIIDGSAPFWGAVLMGGIVFLTTVFVWAIIPRRYEVYDDRLVIAFTMWRWNIGLDSIELVREAEPWQSYGYWGMRFSTKPSQAIELRRIRPRMPFRPNLIISPDDRTIFLAEMNAALSRHKRLHGAPETR